MNESELKSAIIDSAKASDAAFRALFEHCLSNGVFNAWGQPINCTAINDAAYKARAVLKEINEP